MNSTYPKAYLYRRIAQSKIFIDRHFSQKIDVSQIAEEANFSKFHFIRLFKHAYGYTPHQYLKNVRINRAKQLLNQNISITEVCFAVGFDSVSSFSMLFKKMAGRYPSEYLQERKNRQKQPLCFIPGCFAEKLDFH